VSDFVRAQLGPLTALQATGGGDTHATFRATLGDGRSLFVKHSPRVHPFEAEARGLLAMRASGTSLVVPEPLAWDAHHLVLPWLEPGPRAPDAELGEGLAVLHRHTAPAFGFDVDGSCGATLQANPWTEDWPSFFVDHRMRPLLTRLQLSSVERAAADRLLAALPERLVTDEPPALVHGDLWSGNHLHVAGGHALVDPAAHFAHREFELGMMRWLGGFGPAVYDAYHGSWPLPHGWRDRVAIYRFYHVLNHAVLFGGGYRQEAVATVLRLP
jgi:fructosamine-3-kinase